MNESDLKHLKAAIEVAANARAHGNHPFGALLVDENDQVLLQAENTVVTGKDCTGHAETNLMRLASGQFFLRETRAMYLVYKHRTVRDGCRRDSLGKCTAGRLCAWRSCAV